MEKICNRKTILKALQEEYPQYKKATLQLAITTLFQAILDECERVEKIYLHNFGTFYLYTRKMPPNPRGAHIPRAETCAQVRFKPSPALLKTVFGEE